VPRPSHAQAREHAAGNTLLILGKNHYYSFIDDLSRRTPPSAWLKSIEAARADIATSRPGVSPEVIIARLSELEARLRAEAEVESDTDIAAPQV
jgi:hypothetical protein